MNIAVLIMAAALVPPAPPPPPQADTPAVRATIDQAESCFFTEFDKSADLRFRAEKAVRDHQASAPTPAVRAAVLDYVHSRTALKQCMAPLDDARRNASPGTQDRKAIDAALEWMDLNYSGQIRFELAILIGFIDKRAAQEELSFGRP